MEFIRQVIFGSVVTKLAMATGATNLVTPHASSFGEDCNFDVGDFLFVEDAYFSLVPAAIIEQNGRGSL